MQTVDFARSSLTFRIDYLKRVAETGSHEPPSSLNSARILLECVCEIVDNETGAAQTFVMGASCKTERVGVEQDIWIHPNADFVPILSQDRYLIVKTYQVANMGVPFYPPSRGMQPERQVGNVADAYDNLRLDVRRVEGEILDSAAQIVGATLDPSGPPLVGRTVIQEGRYTAVLEFPVKTMNASERDFIYQTDTGPVLMPDFSREPDDLITGLEMAYVAFNCPDWAEFVVRVPTSVGEGIEVYHYSKFVRLDTQNQVIRVS
jgi:hypothetical protein